ncbi:MAG: CYTH domain-containing protein [Cyanobacteria bacterium P01_H01_bin.15]
MGTEIERKFLVKGDAWRKLASGTRYVQGYLARGDGGPGATIRVRVAGEQGFLTVKGPIVGITRSEYEYEIPLADAEEMLTRFCPEQVEKIRYRWRQGELIWEIDEFLGKNLGLIMAEVELKSETQAITIPHWVEREVDAPRYHNSNLAKYPFSEWSLAEKR